MSHALFCLDPGASTGVAALLLKHGESETGPVRNISAFQIQARALKSDRHRTTSYERLAVTLYRVWLHFREVALYEYCVHPDNHLIVAESYITKPTIRSTKQEATSPIYVAMCFRGIALGSAWTYERAGLGPTSAPEPNWSAPSNKQSANDARLKQGGYWIPGKDHARDAIRHGVLKAMQLGYAGVFDRPRRPREPFWLASGTEKPR